MIEAAEALFVAMAFEQTLRPIVEGYQRTILSDGVWRVAPHILQRCSHRAGEPLAPYVTDIKSAWTMHEDDFTVYLKRCNEERIAAGLVVEDEDHCPLLVAENATRMAKRALCDAMASVTNISADKVLVLGMTKYERFVDLSLKLLAPYVRNPLPLVPA